MRAPVDPSQLSKPPYPARDSDFIPLDVVQTPFEIELIS